MWVLQPFILLVQSYGSQSLFDSLGHGENYSETLHYCHWQESYHSI